MSQIIMLQKVCVQCNGTGIILTQIDGGPSFEIPCPWPGCDGTGYVEYGKFILPVNIFHSYEIIETFDVTEYNALTDDSKAAISLLLSCGIVNLNDDKLGKVTLWTAFGEESTTVANLITFIAGE